MIEKSIIWKILYALRDLRAKKVFRALQEYCSGDVLDIGGWDFYLSIKNNKRITYKSWTILENENDPAVNEFKIVDSTVRLLKGDGCKMQLEDSSFDTVLNIQVLEHVFEPIKMVQEVSRVLKPDGYAIFLIPQTGVIHYAPEHYYNFTRFWIQKVMEKSNLEILELTPLGGIWSSMASHLFHFFLQSIRFGGMSYPECKRNFWYFILYPFMTIYALFNIPACMFLSLGDLIEEPNNHFVLVRKKAYTKI